MSDTKPETFSIFQFMKMFPTETAAESYFENKRWGAEISCPHCGSYSTSNVKNRNPMPHRCRDCRKHFSVRIGTVLAESKISLQKWLMAIYMLHTSRKGVSSIQMAKELGITQKSAWFLNHRIREAMASRGGLLGGDKVVEVDETYIGGKEKNKHAHKKLKAGRGSVGKQPVLGMIERQGKVRAFPIAETKKIDLQCAIVENVRRGSTVYSDCHGAYQNLKGYNHEAVAHSVGEYVRDKAHTNGMESFWAVLKCGYYGIHHHISVKHLHRYVGVFAHRHNTSSNDLIDCLGETVMGMIGKRLSYKDLTGK